MSFSEYLVNCCRSTGIFMTSQPSWGFTEDGPKKPCWGQRSEVIMDRLVGDHWHATVTEIPTGYRQGQQNSIKAPIANPQEVSIDALTGYFLTDYLPKKCQAPSIYAWYELIYIQPCTERLPPLLQLSRVSFSPLDLRRLAAVRSSSSSLYQVLPPIFALTSWHRHDLTFTHIAVSL